MKIAIPVYDDNLEIFSNAGHAPYFAVYSLQGEGMFKQCILEGLRYNPRSEHECSGHHDGHDECHHGDDVAHREEHRVMVDLVRDCDVLLVQKACKNTKIVFEESGIRVQKISQGTHALTVATNFVKTL